MRCWCWGGGSEDVKQQRVFIYRLARKRVIRHRVHRPQRAARVTGRSDRHAAISSAVYETVQPPLKAGRSSWAPWLPVEPPHGVAFGKAELANALHCLVARQRDLAPVV